MTIGSKPGTSCRNNNTYTKPYTAKHHILLTKWQLHDQMIPSLTVTSVWLWQAGHANDDLKYVVAMPRDRDQACKQWFQSHGIFIVWPWKGRQAMIPITWQLCCVAVERKEGDDSRHDHISQGMICKIIVPTAWARLRVPSMDENICRYVAANISAVAAATATLRGEKNSYFPNF